jgi:ankyrin repeat protein
MLRLTAATTRRPHNTFFFFFFFLESTTVPEIEDTKKNIKFIQRLPRINNSKHTQLGEQDNVGRERFFPSLFVNLEMNDEKLAALNTSRLIDAININDTTTASSVISSGVVNLDGESLPFHFAVEKGRVEIMTMLLDAGANIDVANDNDCTACHLAIVHNQFNALKLLVERGANVGVIVRCTSLLAVVVLYKRSEPFVILLLDAGAPLGGLESKELFKLVTSVAVFKRLMARKIDLTRVRNEYGHTLCHHVARNVTCEKDLRFLVNLCGKNAVRAMDNVGTTPLHWASSNSNESALRVLVELGAELEEQDVDEWTALFRATREQAHGSHVELLLALGADVNAIDRWGQAACLLAARCKKPAALCALVAAGGNLDQPNNKGETARMLATRSDVHLPTTAEIEAARRRIAKARLDSVRNRAFQICVGLQELNLDALQLCEILKLSFGAIGSLIAFHQWWAIAVKVKHFRSHKP